MSKNINKVLVGKLNSNQDYDDIEVFDYVDNANELIDSILDILNNKIKSEYKGNSDFYKLDYLFIELKKAIINADQIDRNKIKRRLDKLSLKIDAIKLERKKYFTDIEKEIEQLEHIQENLDEITDELENKENKKYEFLVQLVDNQKIEHLEYTFDKFPGFVNLKNKDEICLFRNVVNRFLDNIINYNEKNILFYSNLLSLIKNQKSFNLSNTDKRKCLDEISKVLNKLTYNKKLSKKHKLEIEWINTLIFMIEPELTDKKKNNSIEMISKKYDISVFFENEIIEEVEKIENPLIIEKYKDRNIVDDYIITIDKNDAIEIDDGISCKKLENENYLLGVHIASILGYFDYDSKVVNEAINRIHSLYLSKNYQEKENEFNSVIPLFPFDFSANKASLLPNEYRLARSYYFEIDKNGNIINESFYKTIVKSSNKTTYQEINKILDENNNETKLEETIYNLNEVVKILENKFRPLELYEDIKNTTDNPSDLKVNQIGAEKLVYYSMMLTGNEVANYFANNNYPCLYRTLELNPETNNQLSSMIKNLTNTYGGKIYDKLYQLVSGLYPKAIYSKSGSHDGLRLEHYCHCTSGLRRAADIVVEHSLEVCYDKEPTQEELIELEREIDRVSDLINEKSKKLEWFSNEYKQLTKRR